MHCAVLAVTYRDLKGKRNGVLSALSGFELSIEFQLIVFIDTKPAFAVFAFELNLNFALSGVRKFPAIFRLVVLKSHRLGSVNCLSSGFLLFSSFSFSSLAFFFSLTSLFGLTLSLFFLQLPSADALSAQLPALLLLLQQRLPQQLRKTAQRLQPSFQLQVLS